MDLQKLRPSEEQLMLRESAARFFADEYDFESRREFLLSPARHSEKTWQAFAEMGWLAMPFSEQDGGFGFGAADICAFMQELGRGLVVEPFVSSVLLAGGALSAAPDSQTRTNLIQRILDGSTIATLAITEPDSRYQLPCVTTQAERTEDGYLLTGRKSLVADAPLADIILVPARTSGDPQDKDGISLFCVEKQAQGISLRACRTIDGGYAADVDLVNVHISEEALIGVKGKGLSLIHAGVEKATLAICAEAVGIMKAVIETTAEYLQDRHQFGQPLSRFQSLQHRMADMYVAMKRVEATTAIAALEFNSNDDAHRQKLLSAAKVRAGKEGRYVGEQGVQLHGGIGVSDECIISHYLKRLTAIDALFGNAQFHSSQFLELTGS